MLPDVKMRTKDASCVVHFVCVCRSLSSCVFSHSLCSFADVTDFADGVFGEMMTLLTISGLASHILV